MENGLEKRRIEELDILKGIGISLMVLDHCMAWGESVFIHSLIQSFHMPLFFFASGFLLKKRSVKETIKSKTKSVLFPHFYFAAFYACVFVLLFLLGKRGGGNAKECRISLFFFNGIRIYSVCFTYLVFASVVYCRSFVFNNK